jgi:hypothetical protein
LLEKGWTEEEIEKTTDLLYSDEKVEKHVQFRKATHPMLYWIGLIVAMIGNFILTVALVPFLMILNSAQVYVILGIVGFVFGYVFHVIIKDIEHVDEKHHLVAGIFTPAIALIIVFFMTTVANRFNEVINNPNPHNPWVLSIVYLICFSAPYFIYKIKDLLWEKRQKAQESAA